MANVDDAGATTSIWGDVLVVWWPLDLKTSRLRLDSGHPFCDMGIVLLPQPRHSGTVDPSQSLVWDLAVTRGANLVCHFVPPKTRSLVKRTLPPIDARIG